MRTRQLREMIGNELKMEIPRYFVENMVARGLIRPRLDLNRRRIWTNVDAEKVREYAKERAAVGALREKSE